MADPDAGSRRRQAAPSNCRESNYGHLFRSVSGGGVSTLSRRDMFRENHSQRPDPTTHDRNAETFTVRFDPTDDRPVSADVIDSVAAVTGVDPTDMRPLYEAVDPDALDRLFDPVGDDPADTLTVSFRYEGETVSVHADGRIAVTVPDPN